MNGRSGAWVERVPGGGIRGPTAPPEVEDENSEEESKAAEQARLHRPQPWRARSSRSVAELRPFHERVTVRSAKLVELPVTTPWVSPRKTASA